MFDKVTLSIRGDLNPLKKRLLENPCCSTSVTFSGKRKKDDIQHIYFDAGDDLFTLDQFLNVLAEYIIDRYEPRFIERLLQEGFPTLLPAGHREVLRSVKDFADDCEVGKSARKQSILLSLYDYLRDSSEMLLDGFVAFRLKDYEAILETLTERIVEECITQHEYEDFIGLLKYFVNIQENRPRLTHLVITADGSYALISETGENITERCLAEFIDSEEFPPDANFDDLLISMLITLAPQNIALHNSEHFRNKELLQTIKRVFDGHVTYCRGCELCSVKSSTNTKI